MKDLKKMTTEELKEKLETTSWNASCIYKLLNDENVFIVDHERRKIQETSQTFSLDNDYISHIEEFISYEYYVEYAMNCFYYRKSDQVTQLASEVFKFKNIDALNYVDELIKRKKGERK